MSKENMDNGQRTALIRPRDYGYSVNEPTTRTCLTKFSMVRWRKFLPTCVMPKAGFVDGVELKYWNGVPIERAVDLYAERETGGRPDARLARALESLTIRPARYALPPDEKWVEVSFKTRKSKEPPLRVFADTQLPGE